MSYKIVNNYVPRSKYNIKATYPMTPLEVCVHNTANEASARNEVAYMIRNNNMTSYHVAIDDEEAVQAIPFNRNAWAAGDGANGRGNRRAIHIEICYSMDNGYGGRYSPRHAQAEKNAALYIAHVLVQYGWGVDRLKQHWDYSRKDCPHKMRAWNNWQAFKNMVQKNINDIKGGKPSKPSKSSKPSAQSKPSKPSKGRGTGGAGNIKYKWNNWKTNRHGTHYVAVDATFVVGDTGIWPYENGPFVKRANRAPSIVKPGTTVKFYELRRQDGYVWGTYKTGSGRERDLPIKKWNGGGGRVTNSGLFGKFV